VKTLERAAGKSALYRPLVALTACLLLVSLLVGASGPATAQSYPSRPVRFIVPIAPGGGGDLTTRAVAQKLQALWGQNVVVDNRAGGTGTIGLETTANSRPDGYTISLCTASHAARQAMQAKLPFDLLRSFTPVTQVTAQSYILVVHPSVPARTVAELLARANEAPRGLTYGSAGLGSMQHLSGALLSTLGKGKLLHVPYKGGGPALVDLLAGQIDMIFATPLEGLQHVHSGKLRALAVSGARRLKSVPKLPTVAEAGIPGYQVSQWYGVLAPAGLPAPLLAKLSSSLIEVLRAPDLVERFARDDVELIGSTPDEFRAHIVGEIKRFENVAKATGLKLD